MKPRVEPAEPNNFWKPVPRDLGAHGPFDDLAHGFSPQLWLSKHRTAVSLGLLAAAGVAALTLVPRGGKERS